LATAKRLLFAIVAKVLPIVANLVYDDVVFLRSQATAEDSNFVFASGVFLYLYAEIEIALSLKNHANLSGL
jgi:hypothetical protein